jgi:hypothetical protein
MNTCVPALLSDHLWQGIRILAFSSLYLFSLVVTWLLLRPATIDPKKFHPAKGTTMAEMRRAFPPPHNLHVNRNGLHTWIYHTDTFGIGVATTDVVFDANDCVDHV